MKKIYENPEMQVIEINTECALLVVSNPGLAGELKDEDEWD